MIQTATAAEQVTRTRARLACAVVCASALLGGVAAHAQQDTPAEVAYHSDKQIVFRPAAVRRGRVLVIGDAVLGPVLKTERPNDRRPNLYVVCPGNDGSDDYKLVTSMLPKTDEPVDWDVYWVVVLDPSLHANLLGERDLIVAAQDGFVPAELFDFDEIPGAALLRDWMHIDSIAALGQFRRPDGTLPRVLITPSHFTIKASAIDPDAPPPESRITRALSRLHKKPQPPPKHSVTGSGKQQLTSNR